MKMMVYTGVLKVLHAKSGANVETLRSGVSTFTNGWEGEAGGRGEI